MTRLVSAALYGHSSYSCCENFDFVRRCSKGPFIATQLNWIQLKSTSSWVEFSCVAINGALGIHMTGVIAYAGFLSWCLSLLCCLEHTCALRYRNTIAYGNCEWTMLDFAAMCGYVEELLKFLDQRHILVSGKVEALVIRLLPSTLSSKMDSSRT